MDASSPVRAKRNPVEPVIGSKERNQRGGSEALFRAPSRVWLQGFEGKAKERRGSWAGVLREKGLEALKAGFKDFVKA